MSQGVGVVEREREGKIKKKKKEGRTQHFKYYLVMVLLSVYPT